jgi:hypothetical protein
MYAISNSLAKAKINESINAVEVKFHGFAIPHIFEDTLEVIKEIGFSNNINNWLFMLDNFSGILPHQFINLVFNWSTNLKEMKSGNLNPGRIAIYSDSEYIKQLNLNYITRQQDEGIPDIQIHFTNKKSDAIEFLISRKSFASKML